MDSKPVHRSPFGRRTVLGAIGGASAAMLLPSTSALAASGPSAAASSAASSEQDRAFFGIWDASAGIWSVTGRLNYAAAATLGPVEAAVKAGDYAAAGERLAEHFAKRSARPTLSFQYNGTFRPGLVPLFIDHIWTLGTGEIYQDIVTVGATDSAVEADVTDAVKRSFATGDLIFFLMARHKEPSTAAFRGRTADSGAPVLQVTRADGTTASFSATADTYIKAGADASRNFGAEPDLQVRDEGSGAFSAETRKAYLAFRLDGITEAPVSAVLRLTGRNATTADAKQVIVYQSVETFNETTRTWANTVQNTFSWQGDAGGFDWKGPAGADVEYGYQLPRCYFAGPMADAYRSSGDESIAAGLVDLLTDFIRDADGYNTTYGAGAFPRSLDTANRIINWIYAHEILRSSPSLSATASTSILRTLDKAGRYLAVATHSVPNWMQAHKQALAAIAIHFPEFTAGPDWITNAGDFLTHQLSQALYADGGYTEASDGYAVGVANTFVGLVTHFAANGHQLGGAQDLGRLARFLADQNLPGGWGPGYGDSGSADRRATFVKLADALDDPHLRYVGTDGQNGTAPDHDSVLYPDTRVAVLRSGWRPDASYLRFSADRGAHAHPDELAVTLYAHGRQLLPNMGAFSYSNDPRSNWLRMTTESHTTVEIDGKAQKPDSAAGFDLFATNGVFDAVRAWSDATAGVRHSRSVLFVRPGMWLVSDRLDPTDSAVHTYRQNWHLLPDARPALDADSKSTVTAFPQGANLLIAPAQPDLLTAEVRDGYYSPAFYNITDTKYVTYSRQATGPAVFNTLLLPAPEGRRPQAAVEQLPVAGVPDGAASALTIAFDSDRSATYCIAHVDSRCPLRFGRYGYDGTLAYLARDRHRQTWLLHGGKRLTHRDDVLVASSAPMADVAVSLDPRTRTVAITGSRLVVSTDRDKAVRIHAPWARTVTVNGRKVAFERRAGAVLAAAMS
ncbi:heparinase II/III family protein [Streptomyces sp. NPDC007861]|uniref:heparinase II/III family protein n=1 Tax=Streptomyces sp. NPDC007861 TaxID=3154893 RepID=UPI0033E1D08F